MLLSETSLYTSSQDDILTLTFRTMELISFVLYHKDHISTLIRCSHIFVANETESVIQGTGGHASPPVKDNGLLSLWGCMSTFFQVKSMQEPDEPYILLDKHVICYTIIRKGLPKNQTIREKGAESYGSYKSKIAKLPKIETTACSVFLFPGTYDYPGLSRGAGYEAGSAEKCGKRRVG
jgi:hypothetical protein